MNTRERRLIVSSFKMAHNQTEKTNYEIQGATTPPSDHGVKHIVETRGAAQGEAADIYGDIATAEKYGYVERK